MLDDIRPIGGAPLQHDRMSDYEPTAVTADELKRAGVTLADDDSSGCLYLICDHCGEPFFPVIDRSAPWADYWICPNTRKAEQVAGDRFPDSLDV